MSTYTQQLAKDLRTEVARREDDLARLRAALAAVENGQPKRGRPPKAAPARTARAQ